MKSKNFIPYGRQWIDQDDINAVVNVLRSDFITQGPVVDEFEKKLCDICGCKYAVVLNSGTSALHAAYFTAGLSAGDRFITTPMTFVATANAGLYLGARPDFVDIELDTGNIDCRNLKEAIHPETKLISVVHFAGHPVDLNEAQIIARENKLILIEDASHALGSRYKDTLIGSCEYSDMTTLSFHPVKHIATGEGGAVLTNKKEYFDLLMKFRTHGITKTDLKKDINKSWYYEQQHLGYNYRMTDMQAALGLSQLQKLTKFVARRREIVNKYNAEFAGNKYFEIPVEHTYAFSAYHLYFIRLKQAYAEIKDKIMQRLRDHNIGTQVHYIPVYTQPYYQDLGYPSGSCPNAEDFYDAELSLPLYPAMTDEDVDEVVEHVLGTLSEFK